MPGDSSVSVLIAFGAGALSIMSPCLLILLPPYIAYLTGTSVSELKSSGVKQPVICHSLLFVAGFSLLFIMFGASASLVGRILLTHQDIVRKLAGILIIVFGLHVGGILTIPVFLKEKRPVLATGRPSLLNSLLLGMSFAAGWTPCTGPILGSILLLTGVRASLAGGVLLLVSYSLGMAVPFILIALTIERATVLINFMNRHHRAVQIASSVLMILLGIAVFFGRLSVFP